MSNNPQNAILLQKKPTFVQRAKDAAFVGAVTGSALLLTSGANAASSLDFTGATGELDGVKTAVIGIIGTLVVLIGIGIAWSYFKRTAK
jgi:microcompartment protein CcmK/EutM